MKVSEQLKAAKALIDKTTLATCQRCGAVRQLHRAQTGNRVPKLCRACNIQRSKRTMDRPAVAKKP